MDFPAPHPALLGVAVAGGIAWAAIAPERVRGLAWSAAVGGTVAVVVAVAGLVPWSGRMQITAHAVCMLLGFLLGWWIAARRAAAYGIDQDLVRMQIALGAVFGILGARLWYVVEYRREFPDPAADPGAWLALAADLDRGGAVWFGGLLLAGIALALHARRAGVPLIPWGDCLAPAILAGLAMGRIGCFFNGCCFGAPCDLPWAVLHHGVLVHPTQLYEAGVVAVLAFVVSLVPPGRGYAAGWALVGYAAWRFANETMRGDYAVKLGEGFSLWPPHLTSSQWFCLPLAALGIWLLVTARRRT